MERPPPEVQMPVIATSCNREVTTELSQVVGAVKIVQQPSEEPFYSEAEDEVHSPYDEGPQGTVPRRRLVSNRSLPTIRVEPSSQVQAQVGVENSTKNVQLDYGFSEDFGVKHEASALGNVSPHPMKCSENTPFSGSTVGAVSTSLTSSQMDSMTKTPLGQLWHQVDHLLLYVTRKGKVCSWI